MLVQPAGARRGLLRSGALRDRPHRSHDSPTAEVPLRRVLALRLTLGGLLTASWWSAAAAGTAAPDYTVTTTGDSIVVTDLAGHDDTLSVSQPGSGLIRFAASSRTFAVDGGPLLAGSSGNLPLASVSKITLRASAGADVIDVASFSETLPSLELDGGAGDDSVSFLGDLDFADGASLDVDLRDDAPTPGVDVVRIATGVNLRASGTGTITIRCAKTVSLSTGSSLETVDGDLTVEANQQLIPTPGNFSGLQIVNGVIRSTGAGAITLRGRGGDDETGTQNGVRIQSGGDVIGGTLRPVTVEGTGGTSTGPENAGVAVAGAGSTLTSSGADVHVTGQGGGSGALGGNYGVLVESGGLLSAGGTGDVVVDGTGGFAEGISNFGVLVFLPGATITSGGGDVTITGHGGGTGSSGFDDGVLVQAGGLVTAGGMGSVLVRGIGGRATGNLNRGVDVNNTGSAITSGGGNVTILGEGGGSGGSGSNYGIYLRNGGLVSAGATGRVSLGGYAGVSAGASSHGVLVNTNGVITSGGGDVSIAGVEGSAPDDVAIDVSLGTVSTAANGGTLDLIGNSMVFDGAATIAAASGDTIRLRPYTSGIAIDLGTTTHPSAGPLSLSDAALDRVTAGTIVIGSGSGSITVSAPITRAAATNLELTTVGGDVRFDPGSLDLASGALRLAPGGSGRVRPVTAGTEVTASALWFGDGTTLALTLDGTTPDTGYQRLGVAGGVDLTGAGLVLEGFYVAVVGDTFVVVDNDGAEPVAGAFTALPEGTSIPNVLGSSLSARISYAGGTGNDVVLTVFDPDPMAVLLRLFEVEVVSEGVRLRWQFGEASEPVAAWVERADDVSGPWTRMSEDVAIEEGVSTMLDRAGTPGVTDVYRLVAELRNGRRVTFAPTLTEAGEPPLVSGLTRLSPNPATDLVRIEFTLAHASRIRVTVCDAQGRNVARVLDEARPAGRHQVVWDGVGARGPLPAGVYFVRFIADGVVDVRRVLLTR